MRDVGVRESKAKASEIVRNVWKRRARYPITHRGRPVGLLLPLDKAMPQRQARSPSSDSWGELERPGMAVAKRRPEEKPSGDILSKMRG
jgi:antitoxin (DNA-binding transcriptional repressor) of toxin-antitoxin stability system